MKSVRKSVSWAFFDPILLFILPALATVLGISLIAWFISRTNAAIEAKKKAAEAAKKTA